MAKGGGRLWGLKSVVKRWCAGGGGATAPEEDDGEQAPPPGLHPVYVGKSRRCYLVSSHLLDHPLFRVLVQRSAAAVSFPSPSPSLAPAVVVVGCEVVLFEHLLWMLQNGDPPPDSPEELADLYAC